MTDTGMNLIVAIFLENYGELASIFTVDNTAKKSYKPFTQYAVLLLIYSSFNKPFAWVVELVDTQD